MQDFIILYNYIECFRIIMTLVNSELLGSFEIKILICQNDVIVFKWKLIKVDRLNCPKFVHSTMARHTLKGF